MRELELELRLVSVKQLCPNFCFIWTNEIRVFSIRRCNVTKQYLCFRIKIFSPINRIINLAIPKRRRMPGIDNAEVVWDAKTWYDYPAVAYSALTYKASERLGMLSWPKSLPSGYEPDRSVYWTRPVGLYDIQVYIFLSAFSALCQHKTLLITEIKSRCHYYFWQNRLKNILLHCLTTV